jgi:hypothetical protein
MTGSLKSSNSSNSSFLDLVLDSLAPGLTRKAQLEVLFQTYELGPDLLQTRLRALDGAPDGAQGDFLIHSLELARDYCIYREQASSQKRVLARTHFPWNLIRDLPPQIRAEAREWLGFWAQGRQGHWSDVQWVERGVRTHVNFEARELFARCLPLRPRALVLVHNHPSGNTEPSWIDLQLTRQVGTLALHLGIELKGHWIVGPHSETWIPTSPHPKNPRNSKTARTAARPLPSASAASSALNE